MFLFWFVGLVLVLVVLCGGIGLDWVWKGGDADAV